MTSKLYNEVRTSTNVLNGEEYKDLFCAIAGNVSDIVSTTLGPFGATTIIDDGTGFTYPTKDGWSCMSRIRFNDPIYNTIFGIIKQVSFNSANTVGDGTTTAMVATNYFLQSFYKNLIPFVNESNGEYRQADLMKSMRKVTAEITRRLQANPNIRRINPDGDMSDIYKIAYIATNGNDQFASMIQEIYKETKNPNIRIEIDGGSPETTFQIEKGYRFDSSIIGFENYVNADNKMVKIDTPCKIVLFDHNVTYAMHQHLISGMSLLASQLQQTIILVAPNFDDLITAGIDAQVTQMQRRGQYPNIMLVQLPIVTKMHRQSLVDLTMLTGGLAMTESAVQAFNIMQHNQTCTQEDQMYDDEILKSDQFSKYKSPSEIIKDYMGTIIRASFTATSGYIQDYESVYNKAKFDAMYRECEESYLAARKSANKTIGGVLDKDFLFMQNRYIRLTGNNALIKVGGISDIQKRCDKDALDDAILACRSAYEYGYVRGTDLEILGVTFDIIHESIIDNDKSDAFNALDRQVADTIFWAFEQVFFTILANRYGEIPDNPDAPTRIIKASDGHEYPIKFTNTFFEDILTTAISNNYAYNLITEEFEDQENWSVINSVQTDIEIMTAMTSILTTVMSSTQFLSMHQSGDLKATHRRALEIRLEDEREIAKAKAEGYSKVYNPQPLVTIYTPPTDPSTPSVPTPSKPWELTCNN